MPKWIEEKREIEEESDVIEEEQLLCLEIEREFFWGQNLEVLIGFEEEMQKQSADSYKSWLFDE